MFSSGKQVIVQLVVDELVGPRSLSIDVTEEGELSVLRLLTYVCFLHCASPFLGRLTSVLPCPVGVCNGLL